MKVVLEVVEGPDKGRRFVYEGFQSFVLGREGQEDAAMQVPSDPYMSRHHVQLEFAGNECRVRDLNSRNGFTVNGRATDEAVLKHGALLRAGRTKMRVFLHLPDDPPSEDEPLVDGEADLRDFEILDVIGSGNCGDVFRAKWKTTGQMVAIKLIAIKPWDSSAAVQHFLREMSITRRLDHPHIVETLASGRYRDRLWLAMELITGPTLRKFVEKRGPLPVREAVAIARQYVSAIAHAHAKGFVHRDIKPSNVLLARGGRTKLCDFGIAKSTRDPGSPSLTLTGRVKGTPRYMPREQVLNAKLAGPAADIFSAGASLYWALTRKWHYKLKDGNAWATILEGKNVPIRERRPDIPASVAAVVDKALRAEPERRHKSAAELLRALEAAARVAQVG